MAWLDVDFPRRIAMGAISSPGWRTDVAMNDGGFEQRSQVWTRNRHKFDVSMAVRTASDYATVLAHFNMARGQAHKFGFKDFLDYRVEASEGVLTAVTGAPDQFQLSKRYGSGAYAYDRKITRPTSTPAAAIYRGGSAATAGGGAGQYSLDAATGVVTFVADQTRSVNSHTVGATHEIVLASAFSPNVSPGNTIYLSGVTGTAATLLNGVALIVATVTGATITVSVNTTGLTASGGTAARRALSSELSWSGQFNVPCRYGVDSLPAQMIDRNGSYGELLIKADSIPIVEVRE